MCIHKVYDQKGIGYCKSSIDCNLKGKKVSKYYWWCEH